MIAKDKKSGLYEICLVSIKNPWDIDSIRGTFHDVIEDSCANILDHVQFPE